MLRNPCGWGRGGPLSGSGHLGVKDGGREGGGKEEEEEEKEEGGREREKEDRWREKIAQHRIATKERRVAGNERFRRSKRAQDREKEGATRRVRVGIVLTLISLRMTSIMLPITMRKSNTFQGSLKYPYTG